MVVRQVELMAAMAAEQSVPQAVPPPLPRMVPVTASVVCMCGLPGSGKSTLARSLLDSSVVLDKEGEGGDVRGRSVLIDYDVLARDLAAATNEGDVASPPQPEQEERPQRVLSLFDQSDLDSWRQSRRLALSSLETELKSHFNNVGDGDAAAEGVASLHSHLLVVLDDNFHLRSMRREVHRVCQRVVSSWGEWGGEFRGHGAIGFSVLYVDTPLTVCLERNSHRRGKERVPDATVELMAQSIEVPEGATFAASAEAEGLRSDYSRRFEACSIHIKPGGDGDREGGSGCHYSAHADTISDCLMRAVRYQPVTPPKKRPERDADELREERRRTRENRLHRSDILLRALVASVGRADRSLGRAANNARRVLLEELRKGGRRVLGYGDGYGEYYDGDTERVGLGLVRDFKLLLRDGCKTMEDGLNSSISNVIDAAYDKVGY